MSGKTTRDTTGLDHSTQGTHPARGIRHFRSILAARDSGHRRRPSTPRAKRQNSDSANPERRSGRRPTTEHLGWKGWPFLDLVGAYGWARVLPRGDMFKGGTGRSDLAPPPVRAR